MFRLIALVASITLISFVATSQTGILTNKELNDIRHQLHWYKTKYDSCVLLSNSINPASIEVDSIIKTYNQRIGIQFRQIANLHAVIRNDYVLKSEYSQVVDQSVKVTNQLQRDINKAKSYKIGYRTAAILLAVSLVVAVAA